MCYHCCSQGDSTCRDSSGRWHCTKPPFCKLCQTNAHSWAKCPTRHDPSIAQAALQRAQKAEQEAATLKRNLEVQKQLRADSERAAFRAARNFQVEVNIQPMHINVLFILILKC